MEPPPPMTLPWATWDGPLFFGEDAGQGPVVLRVRGFGGAGVSEADVVGQVLRVGVVRAGLEKEHGQVGVLGQPGSDHRAGGTAADYDNVVFHLAS